MNNNVVINYSFARESVDVQYSTVFLYIHVHKKTAQQFSI